MVEQKKLDIELKLGTLSERPSTFGADPELFFKDSKGNIVGSEKVIPEVIKVDRGKIIRDGVQLEFNPNATFCRAIFGNNFYSLFKTLKEHLAQKDYEICWEQVIKINPTELASLSKDSRKFGCMPSYNIYLPKDDNVSVIVDNPETYLFRSAGGHIHVDFHKLNNIIRNGQYVRRPLTRKEIESFVKSMDIIVGNTCVILDRHPLSVERRRNYGKAGEYRLPSYGIEYRTLSNFWLRDYQLMSMVYGLMMMAYRISLSEPHYNKLISLVKEEDIIKAINTNNKFLAKQNFNKVKKFLAESMSEDSNDACFTTSSLKYFDHFLKKDLKYWFGKEKDYLKNWTKISKKFYPGFEGYLATIVKNDME